MGEEEKSFRALSTSFKVSSVGIHSYLILAKIDSFDRLDDGGTLGSHALGCYLVYCLVKLQRYEVIGRFFVWC